MITKEKLLQSKPASWHVILLAAVFVLMLASSAVFFYWYMFGGKNKLPTQKLEPARGAYVYPRYKLENVIKQKIFGSGVDVSR
ncbi:hypothetical protein HGA34_04450 [Candidatus Falkowbacteria bacterium]|nr:hypothetical protein [Candidatus Falkowbacteria bacterium]